MSGDNIYALTKKYNIKDWMQFAKDNGVKAPNYWLTIGDTLNLPEEAVIPQHNQTATQPNPQPKAQQQTLYEQINTASLGSEVHLVVETTNLHGKKVTIEVFDKAKLFADDDKTPIKLIKDNTEVTKLENVTIDDTGKATIKVKLHPKSDEDYKTLKEKFKDDKVAKLYLKVTCKGADKTHEKQFLDGEEFEVKKPCDCGEKFDKQFQCTRYGTAYGPVIWGSKKLENYTKWSELIEQNVVTTSEKDIFNIMSPNEGNLDAIQSYDSEILTAGAMQKTVNPQGKGEFPIQIQEFKDKYPDKYLELFENCGWTVENKTMYYKDPNDSHSTKITGKALKEKIREGFMKSEFKKKLKCKPLEPIAKAMTDEDFQMKQIKDFIDRLRNKVLPIKPTGYSYKLKNI